MPDSPLPIVFLHYFGGAARSWQPVIEQLSADHRCLALDLPGFGSTPPARPPSLDALADYVRAETRRRGLDAFALVGHSMGGKVAFCVAAAEPAVRHLVLVAASPPTTEPMPPAERERMLRHNREEAEKTVENVTAQPLSPPLRALAVETQLIIDEATWRWWLQEGMHHSVADRADRVRATVTVLASDDDPVIDLPTTRRETLGTLPTARLVRTTGVGHLLPLEAPAWVAAQISGAIG